MNAFSELTTVLDAALEYAARGWHVFPVPPGTKKSYKSEKYSGGRRWGATTDPDEICEDWARWPDANVAIATGPQSGLFAIDVDSATGHGVDGLATFNAWIDEHGPIPDTIEATTPSGGLHFFFRCLPGEEIRNSAGRLAAGVDVRGEGGILLAAPSVKQGYLSPYAWRNPPGLFDLADCPMWLLDKIVAVGARPETEPRSCLLGWNARTTDEAEISRLLSYIDPDAGGYQEWMSILMALHDWSNGGAHGLEIADAWSADGASYRPGEVAAKWCGFRAGGGYTKATIAKLAEGAGADLGAIAREFKSSGTRSRGSARGGNGVKKTHGAGAVAATSDGAPRPNEDAPPDLSHDELALALGRASWDDDARHVAQWGRWLFWTGARWEADDRLEHMTRTRTYLRTRAADLIDWSERKAAEIEAKEKDEAAAGKLRAWARAEAKSMRSKATVTAVESLARANYWSVARAADFDADPMLLGTPGGTVDLCTGRIRPAERSDMLSKSTAVAPGFGAPIRWLSFLSEIFKGDAELIAFMQRAAGYALTGEIREHKLLFLYGSGRNGKSVFLDVLSHLWADYARRAPAAAFLHTTGEKHSTDIAGLQGARLVVGSELPKGRTWDESVIKDLTGGEKMTARFMRQDFFDFTPQLTLMIAGNNMPSFRGVDEAIRARVVLVPFTVTIPPEKRDRHLADKLKAEGPQILAWAIEGALAWQRRGLDVPAKVAEASASYFDSEDIAGQFIGDEIDRVVGAFASAKDLHLRFVQWCEGQGLTPWAQHTLIKELRSRCFEDAKSGGQRGLRGMRLRQ